MHEPLSWSGHPVQQQDLDGPRHLRQPAEWRDHPFHPHGSSPFPQSAACSQTSPSFYSAKNKALLSLGQFCDHGFKVKFDRSTVQIFSPTTTLTGHRNPSNGLYFIDLCHPPSPIPSPLPPSACDATPSLQLYACNAYKIKTKADLVQYLH